MPKLCIIVIDAWGIGALPDAAAYGDTGSATTQNCARAVGGLRLPTLQRWGLGNIASIDGVATNVTPSGSFGKMAERSEGKDTTTGHWEMMGVVLDRGFALNPNGFSKTLIDAFVRETGCGGVLGNRAASGTQILVELGAEHLRTGFPIVYTSGDSVFQIAAHESVVPLEKLYAWCETARRLVDPLRIARVIARPFVTTPDGKFVRTYNRRDFSMSCPTETALDVLKARGVPVWGVGKIPDIYDHRGMTREIHTEGNADGLARTPALLAELAREPHGGLLFVNLVDTDMLFGHRRDAAGYARAMQEIDVALPSIAQALSPGDLLVLTGDHGNDPTAPGTDHTREYVPLVCYAPSRSRGSDLGTRGSFADLAQTTRAFFGLPVAGPGRSFLNDVV